MPNYLDVLPLEEAQARYFEAFEKAFGGLREELVPAREALCRVTSRAVYAKMSSPHYYACAMDGIAIDAALTFGATETTPVQLAKAQYTVVDTGEALPPGCDAVVMSEDVITLEGGAIRLLSAASPWQHVRQIGEDIVQGEMILPSYTPITPYAIGALYAGGCLSAPVFAQPVFGIIPTGDEVVAPTDNPPPGAVIEYNSAVFAAMLRQWGASSVTYPVVRDDVAALQAALDTALAQCDAVLILAGSSAGRDDYTRRVIESVGEVLAHGIAIRPGKPAILGLCSEGKPVIGVPGYPVSGVIVMQNFVRPLCEKMLHLPPAPPHLLEATLSRNIVSSLKYHEFIRVRLAKGLSGFRAVPLNRGAGVITSLVKADGFVHVSRDADMALAGEPVTVHLTRPREAFGRMLSIIGSHDPLIDEITDILLRAHGPAVSSMHVGSMGGIMAVKRGEADAAGVHLLDEEGGYNLSYIAKYFPAGGAVLLRGAVRQQGIMVPKGNPLGISGIADIAQKRIPYVNRQKGSGTRILLDYLLAQASVDAKDITGYEREEMTHMAVAAQIASLSAGAGLGIYSAAKAMGLDFVYICDEQYDFLVPSGRMETPEMRSFIRVLQSDEFAQRLAAMGGYALQNPGSIVEVL